MIEYQKFETLKAITSIDKTPYQITIERETNTDYWYVIVIDLITKRDVFCDGGTLESCRAAAETFIKNVKTGGKS